MQSPRVARLSETRLHLNHGPIDLIVTAEGAREAAFLAASARIETVLSELVAELPQLRLPVEDHLFQGSVARRMSRAVQPFRGQFITPMAAVAGAVADEFLETMYTAANLTRAAVNNGGDIALFLAPGQRFDLAMASSAGHDLGRVVLNAEDEVGGIATSGRHGRSFSLGIADSVTVLARTAADADAAATLIANAVDLPGHPAIARQPACELDPDSDLRERLVTIGVGPMTPGEAARAVDAGSAAAETMLSRNLIRGAAIFLGTEVRVVGTIDLQPGR